MYKDDVGSDIAQSQHHEMPQRKNERRGQQAAITRHYLLLCLVL